MVFKNRMEMKKKFCVYVALAAILTVTAVTRVLTAAPDAQAVEIARGMMQAMGGESAWKQARYVRFDFRLTVRGQVKLARAHLWDKQTGRYRLEDRSAPGQVVVMLFNISGQQGTTYVNGKKLEGPAAATALKGACRAYRTDIDWLALPWDWLAPGVHLKYVGEKSLQEQTFDLVEVTVDRPAGAPATRYSSYVSRRSHLLEHCSVGADTSLWDWQYATAGGIQLAADHTNTQRRSSISMGNVRVLDKVDDAFLTDPEHRLAMLK
jgi:hypothetical protein